MRTYRRILAGIILTLAIAGGAFAAKWQTMTFDEDVSKTIEELNHYCAVHGMKIEDVLWANKTSQEELKAGQVIYLPANHADMLSIWQNVGAWKPTALVPKNSAAAANRLTGHENPAQETKTPEPKTETANVKTEPEVKTEVKTEESAKEPKEETKEESKEESKEEAKEETEIDFEKLSINHKAKMAAYKIEITPENSAPKKTTAQVKPVPSVQPAKSTPAPSPSNVIKETAKPDRILTARPKKPQPEIPGLMDPIIILSPNGDPAHGPMRLIISGDKVEVVKLPQSATPKRPSMADLNTTLGTSPGYPKYYDVNNLPKTNNYVPPNMVKLNGKMMWPVDGKISSPFGKWRGKHQHQGIDIPMPQGTPIRAANTGVVARTGNNSTMGFRGYGNFVLLDHGGGVQSFYAHCSSVAVVEGQRIMQGQIIGYVGSTGRSTANHLHFEVRVNDTKVDPMPYLGGNQRLASTNK